VDGLVLTGIGQLFTSDPAVRVDGPSALVCSAGGEVSWLGSEASLPEQVGSDRVDLGGRAVIPGFVDSHTHLVFAGHRAGEWEARMAGTPYAAAGIMRTVEATRAASESDLLAGARGLADEALAGGTTTIEVKSGYGLNVEKEFELLTVARRMTTETTFLGAHVVPPEMAGRPDDYVDLVRGPMLRACAPQARWVDVFCEHGAFDVDQSRAVLEAGRDAGLGLRVHGNQLGPGPGVAMGVELDAASVDHCTHLSSADIDALAESRTVATLLPTAELGTRSRPPNARRLIDAGAQVALATDCNPGSSYTTSMALVVTLAVATMGMTFDEALTAATAGGAAALRRRDVGRLAVGCQADLVVLEAPSASFIAYRPGIDLARAVVRSGALVAGAWPASQAG
jgi:imidazolonepropionase